ncbi:acetyltransferase (GNAT) family protein [Bacillus thuringiensis]|uniref:Acetyltransferase (GNAT) family protein n=1 Tax=Bacillus thuringiensis TaxID=1428 RepID=A0A4R4B4M4_BACTU|nr:acetyltransferase (GNAT) family protein [Bacillus thuringiensis]TCW47733.1 acetyltransferase (GNAT) family protein [Bacillus thuringiensis]
MNTAYYDNVLNKKEVYENPSIELVAEIDGKIVGLIDVEYEKKEKTVCSRGTGLGGMIWHIAVHPDYARQGIGENLLKVDVMKNNLSNIGTYFNYSLFEFNNFIIR